MVTKRRKELRGREQQETYQLAVKLEQKLFYIVPAIGEADGSVSNYSLHNLLKAFLRLYRIKVHI